MAGAASALAGRRAGRLRQEGVVVSRSIGSNLQRTRVGTKAQEGVEQCCVTPWQYARTPAYVTPERANTAIPVKSAARHYNSANTELLW
jgi:hypothetical protein